MDLDDLVNNEKKKSIVKKGIGEEVPYPDNSFDIVLSFNALDHSVDPAKAIREIEFYAKAVIFCFGFTSCEMATSFCRVY
jgi:SAM-dependent methyltransferase